MKKRYRLNLIRAKRSYTVKEAAELLSVHVRTIQCWIKGGLRVLDGSRPFLMMGHELKSFLAVETQKQKRPLSADEFYCVRCRAAVKASGVETFPTDKTMGRDKLAVILKGLCAVCGGKVNRFSTIPKPADGAASSAARME
jgi:excisionase family DNA binding protein